MLRRWVTKRNQVFIISLLLTLILVGADLFTVFVAVTSPARVDNSPKRLAATNVNPYGANLFLQSEVETWKREKTLAMAADAGLGWVKLHFSWEEIEPVRKGDFFNPTSHDSSWAKFDQIVAECEQYGLRIVARLDRPPRWSRADNTIAEAPPDNFTDYGDFVYEFVRHFRGHIQYIQIWNEPNIYPEWGNRPVDPAQYVEMLKIAYRRAKEADPTIQV
ncbi:MAG: cellulase family glycosylhydrolase, partial [Anaerolineae bacterium]